MEEENYDKIISECSKEIDAQGKYMAEALLLRATFYLLIGNANAAKPDLDKVISLKEANVKVHLKMCVKNVKKKIMGLLQVLLNFSHFSHFPKVCFYFGSNYM